MDTAPSSSKEGSNSRAQSPVDRNLSPVRVKPGGPGAGKISSSYDFMPEQGTARGVQQTISEVEKARRKQQLLARDRNASSFTNGSMHTGSFHDRPLSPARDRTGGVSGSFKVRRPQSPARERMGGSFNDRPQSPTREGNFHDMRPQSPAREGSFHDMRPQSPARERTQGFQERRPQSPAREGTGNLAYSRHEGTRSVTDIFKGIQGHLQARPQSPAREGATRSPSPVFVEHALRVPSVQGVPKLSSPLVDNENAKCKYCSVRGTPARMCSIGPHHERACQRWADTQGDGRPGAAGAEALRKTSDSTDSSRASAERLSAEDQNKKEMLQMQMLELKKKLEEQLRRLQVLDFVFSWMGCPRQLILKRRALTK